MSLRSFFSGFFIICGFSAIVLIVTAMFLSMQLDSGSGLLLGVGTLTSGIVAVILGLFILVYRP